MKKQTQIFSIFGQIEAAVAERMIEEGGCNRIPFEQIPPTAAYDEKGNRALFAIVVPTELVQSFEARIATLRQ
jgi:hypothetical protein